MSNDLLSSLTSSVWAIFLIIIFFGGSIFFHELGHFLAARWRGLKVERFSIGFGPAIWSWHGRDGVEYRLSWIPIGGYVALPQLADLSGLEGETSSDAVRLPPASYTTKLIVLSAGAFFNILFALLLATVVWIVGYPAVEEELTNRIGQVLKTIELADHTQVEGPAYAAGLRAGDAILSVDGHTVKTLGDIGQLVALGSGRTATGAPSVEIVYERGGEKHTTTLLPVLAGPDEIRDIGVEPAAKAVVIVSLVPGRPAEKAGLKPHDIITKLNDQPVEYSGFVSEYLSKNGPKPVVLTYTRDGQNHEVTLTPATVTDPKSNAVAYQIGVQVSASFHLKIERTPPFQQIRETVVWTWRRLKSLISPSSDIGIKKLSGPLGIADQVDRLAQIDFRLVLWFVILVNVNLAAFNMLPIPVLDGGHILFATLAKLRGRELPFNVIAAIQSVFMVLLLTLILYVSVFDVHRISRDRKADREAVDQQKKLAPPPAAPAPAKP